MTNSAEENDIIRTVLRYCADSTTHMEPEVLFTPITQYTDAARFQLEQDTLFRRFPIILGHASQAAEPGAFFTHDDTGIPILVTRNRDGEIKAFANVCRHRGARVVTDECGKASTFSCPYHAWTYDLNGHLRGMRQPRGFAEVGKAQIALAELPAFERFGLIWVVPQQSAQTINIDTWLAPMAEQLASVRMEDHSLFREWSVPLNMGWHIALEGFQESYHFCSAHKETACAAYLDNQSVFVSHYPHFRHAVPVSRIAKFTETPAPDVDYRANFMTQNYLFPCNFVQVMTDHIYIHSILPVAPDRCVFRCMMLIPEPAVSDKAIRHWEANYNVVREVFNEDFTIGEGIQKGFAAGVNTHFVIGKYEAGLQLAQRALDDALSGRLKTPVSP